MEQESYDRLQEIREEMKELVSEAEALVASEGGVIYQRAKGYWLAQLTCALDNEHDYLGKSMCTMEDTIRQLAEGEDEDE